MNVFTFWIVELVLSLMTLYDTAIKKQMLVTL